MTWGMTALAGASIYSANKQGKAIENSANASAQAQLEASRISADAAKFRPVGVTTRYGSSNFQFNPQGYVTGAGYTVSPELQAYQDRLQGLTRGALSQAELAPQQYAPLQQAAGNLFGLGQQYLQQSPEQVAQQYMQQQQDLLAPSRERQMAQLQNTLFQQGRGGLSVGATGERPSGAGGLGATSPEMEAYYNAIAQQDAQLAANAQQAGQQNVAFGTGLMGQGAGLLGQYQAGQVSALNPFTTYLGAGSTIESLGQQPLEMGSTLGGRSATAGANVGQALLQGGLLAAKTQQAGSYGGGWGAVQGFVNSPYAAQLATKAGTGISDWWNSTGTPSGAAGYNISPDQFGAYYGKY